MLDVADQELRPNSIFGTVVGMALMNQDGTFIKANPSLCAFLGYEEQELLGEHAEKIIHPEDQPLVIKDYRSWLEDGTEILHLENRYLHKHGHVLRGLVRLSKLPMMDSFLLVIHVTDMTWASEQNGNKANWEIMKCLYHLDSEAVAVVNLEGRIIKVNGTFEKLFGYREDEILGEVPPIGSEEPLHKIIAELKKEECAPLLKLEYETIKRTKEGNLISLYIKLFPIRDESGCLNAVGTVIKDITEQGTLTSQFHDLVAVNLDPVLIFDPAGYVVQSNQAFTEQFGWPMNQVLDRHWSRLPFDVMQSQLDFRQLVHKLQMDNIVTGFETKMLKENGEPVQISLTGFTLKYGRGGAGGAAFILRDISKQKKTEQLMMESEKLSLAGQLAAAIAHEIRNPITSIKGFLKLLQNSERKQQYFDIVNTEIDRIELILSEMLALAKPQTAKFEPRNIRNILEQVASLLIGEANMNGIEILLHEDAGMPEVHCDENQIKQVFINFMKNAIEAMPEGGTLTVEMFPPGPPYDQAVKIVLTDTGTGIPPELLARIGEPFFTTKQSGTGLGFMTSKNIIENHKGMLNISSKQNEGTRIEIRLPVKLHVPKTGGG
ncbi:PAS domain-containing protein [Paenibacillus physcomitrellae]|nr:PAS domain-containing sensor histidine kinase [Paenibacillus physcomitrellae]